MDLRLKFAKLQELLRARAPLLIAYSGGVDSAFLLSAGVKTLGSDCTGVIADSPSLPRESLHNALTLAAQIGATVETITTGELEDPNYASNPINRCYFCKAELFSKLEGVAKQRGFAAIAYGENADDMQQVRPGRQAAAEFSVLAPLRDAGLSKEEIRELSREMGLPTADAPSQPCLSSRIPYGSPVTTQSLAFIEKGEAFVRSLGFKVFRVRHITNADPTRPHARVQIAPSEMQRLETCREALVSGLNQSGYATVEIDPEGYRST